MVDFKCHRKKGSCVFDCAIACRLGSVQLQVEPEEKQLILVALIRLEIFQQEVLKTI